MLFVPKPNGKFRLCVDYRPLNAITVADVHPSRPTDRRIDLVQDHKIPGQKLYMLSPAEDKELQEQLGSLEKLGFIESSVSPFGSGVLFVPKTNVKFRLCVNYRPLNAITVADVYPLPRIDEMIDKAGGESVVFIRWICMRDFTR